MTVLEKYFANPAALPSMPEVAHHLLRSFNDETVSLRDMAALIAKDQGLAAKLLRMANSAHYGRRRTIATLQDAAATVGLTALRDMALAACVAGAFPQVKGFDRLRFWRQCLATAGHARLLAQTCELDTDAAYLAGLVMRTGELLMLMTEPEAVALAESRADAPDSLLEHELELLQCTHLEVTAELARRWQFPAELVAAVAAAADPLGSKPFSRLGAVLRLASVMSDAGDRGMPAMTTVFEAQPDLAHHMKLHDSLEWLEQHLMPYDTLTQGVDQLMK
jgi:HD-like signal output (HDOD) protein